MNYITSDEDYKTLCNDYAVRTVRKRETETKKEKTRRKGRFKAKSSWAFTGIIFADLVVII